MNPEFQPEIAAAIFGAELVSDVLYTYYVARVADHKALQATIASVLLFATSMYSLKNIVDDPMYLIPGGAGVAVGTFAGVKYEEWKLRHQPPGIAPPTVIYKHDGTR